MKGVLQIYNHFTFCILFAVFFFFNLTVFPQAGFRLPNGVKNEKIKFELINNLIVLPINVNGIELSFILDTGVGSTILFSIDDKESLELKNTSKIFLRGLGDKKPVPALKSIKNKLRVGKSISSNHLVYLVLDKEVNLSPRMGVPIHGIIGYEFFKNRIVKINYSKKIVRVYDSKFFKNKKSKKWFKSNLRFGSKKLRPFMTVEYMNEEEFIDLNLLIDTGSGSSLWLFDNPEKNIEVGDDYFVDFLGKGLNGDVFGKKTKTKEIKFGPFNLKNVNTSFPDPQYINGISLKERQGSIGGGVLRKFNLIFDYSKGNIFFKKNSFFNIPFYYNMSGITVQHKGFHYPNLGNGTNSYLDSENAINKQAIELYNSLVLHPKYEVSNIKTGSPADLVGLRKGDVIRNINGSSASVLKLSTINQLFRSKEGKRIRLEIDRKGVRMNFVFRLEKVL